VCEPPMRPRDLAIDAYLETPRGHNRCVSLSCCAAWLTLALAIAPARPSVAGEVEGVYLVENGEAHIELLSCGEELCGRIVWLREPLDENGEVPRDVNNPEPSLRDRTILGLQLLSGLRPASDSDGQWIGGRIYDPESGRTYRCKLRHDGVDRVRLRGYLGIPLLGSTTVWTRIATRAAGSAAPGFTAGSE